MVTDQMPVASSFVIGYDGLPSISPMSSTDRAFGARKRSVTVRSELTWGETTCGPRPPPAPRPCAVGGWAPEGVAGDCARALPTTVAVRAIRNESAARFIEDSMGVYACTLLLREVPKRLP